MKDGLPNPYKSLPAQNLMARMHVQTYLHPIANPQDRLSYSEYGRVEPGSIFCIHRGRTA